MFPRLHVHDEHARGYKAIICNGEVTWDEGRCTGATPGRLLRGGHAA